MGAYAHWYHTVGGLLSKVTEHFLILLKKQGLEVESAEGIPGRSQLHESFKIVDDDVVAISGSVQSAEEHMRMMLGPYPEYLFPIYSKGVTSKVNKQVFQKFLEEQHNQYIRPASPTSKQQITELEPDFLDVVYTLPAVWRGWVLNDDSGAFTTELLMLLSRAPTLLATDAKEVSVAISSRSQSDKGKRRHAAEEVTKELCRKQARRWYEQNSELRIKTVCDRLAELIEDKSLLLPALTAATIKRALKSESSLVPPQAMVGGPVPAHEKCLMEELIFDRDLLESAGSDPRLEKYQRRHGLQPADPTS